MRLSSHIKLLVFASLLWRGGGKLVLVTCISKSDQMAALREIVGVMRTYPIDPINEYSLFIGTLEAPG